MPTSLVVKKGSNTRSSRSAGTPTPLSCTLMTTKRPARPGAAPSAALAAWMRSDPPPGIASRALTARLISASSSSATSTCTGAVSASTCTSTRTFELTARRDQRLRARQMLLQAHLLRVQRAAARERQQLAGQLGAARHCAFDRRQLRAVGHRRLQAPVQVDVVGDHHHQVVEVVRHAAAQPPPALRVSALGAGCPRRARGAPSRRSAPAAPAASGACGSKPPRRRRSTPTRSGRRRRRARRVGGTTAPAPPRVRSTPRRAPGSGRAHARRRCVHRFAARRRC